MDRPGIRATFLGVIFGLFAAVALATLGGQAQATEIRYVVNGLPVTSYDIEKRVAFLRLQRKGGNLREQATQEMIDQALRSVEMKRLGIEISDQAVEQAFGNFAKSNKLSTSQMEKVMAQSGVTARHFKEFIRAQIGWNQALGARFRATGRMSEADVVQRMLQQGGTKPTATEYLLQQVIFVVPAAERGSKMASRRREAEAMRNRFTGCADTMQFARGLIDVTVRELGRILEPELPPDWADHIKATSAGQATRVRETERGVEFIGVCNAREVSDDRVAQMVFQTEGPVEEKAEELSRLYMSELKEKARIVER